MFFLLDYQSQCKVLEAKETEILRQLEEEHSRAERLELEAQRCFEAEEQAARYKDQLDSVKQELATMKSDPDSIPAICKH